MELELDPSWQQQLPWRCFHCGEVFYTRQDAADHFGQDEFEPVACVQVLTETQRALVEDRRHWRHEALRLGQREEQLQYQLAQQDWELRHFGKDVRSLSQARMRFQDEVAARRSAEAKVRELVMRLQDAKVPWLPLQDESRSEWEILTEGGRLPVVDGPEHCGGTIYGYARSEQEAQAIADRFFADPIVRVELCDWTDQQYGWLALTAGAAVA